MKKVGQLQANLRVCARCEFIFKGHRECPDCGFATYGARFVYGNSAYRLAKTQERWLKNKLWRYETLLMKKAKKLFEEKVAV